MDGSSPEFHLPWLDLLQLYRPGKEQVENSDVNYQQVDEGFNLRHLDKILSLTLVICSEDHDVDLKSREIAPLDGAPWRGTFQPWIHTTSSLHMKRGAHVR